MPGLASSVEERSLCKNFRPRGPRFEFCRGLLFRRDKINSQFMFDGKSNYRMCYITHSTSMGKKAVATSSLGKRERSSNKLAL